MVIDAVIDLAGHDVCVMHAHMQATWDNRRIVDTYIPNYNVLMIIVRGSLDVQKGWPLDPLLPK